MMYRKCKYVYFSVNWDDKPAYTRQINYFTVTKKKFHNIWSCPALYYKTTFPTEFVFITWSIFASCLQKW